MSGNRLRTALGQAALIIALSAVLGFGYTAARGTGLFARAGADLAQRPAPVFISYDEALAYFRSDTATFLDARHPFDYGLGHIKGAINIPLSEFDSSRQALQQIPKSRLIVTYCDGVECNSSIGLALKLDSAGYSRIRIFFSGWREWTDNKQPVDQ